MYSRVSRFLSLLRSVVTLDRKKDIKSLLSSCHGEFVKLLAEIAYNTAVVGTISLNVEEKKGLRKFSKQILSLVSKKIPLKEKRKILCANPILVQKLAWRLLKEIDRAV